MPNQYFKCSMYNQYGYTWDVWFWWISDSYQTRTIQFDALLKKLQEKLMHAFTWSRSSYQPVQSKTWMSKSCM